MKKVMVFGTFDILHQGHISFLKQAKECGDYLYIVVAQDDNVERIKKKRPENPLPMRIAELERQKFGDEVLPGGETDFFRIIEEKKPDIICLGYDQKSRGLYKEIKSRKWNLKVMRLKPFEEHRYKSSLLSDSAVNSSK